MCTAALPGRERHFLCKTPEMPVLGAPGRPPRAEAVLRDIDDKRHVAR